VRPDTPLTEGLLEMSRKRLGLTAVVDGDDRVVGIFTDGDLRRLLDERGQLSRQDPIDDYMTHEPKCVRPEALLEEAERLLRERRVDQVPVVAADGRPVGLLDVQDLLDTRL